MPEHTYYGLTITDQEDNEIEVDVTIYWEPADRSVGIMTASREIQDVCYAGTKDPVPDEVWEPREADIEAAMDREDDDEETEALVSRYEERKGYDDWRWADKNWP